MPRKYSRSSKSSRSRRSRRSRRIRRQRGGGLFNYVYIVTYNGNASAGTAKLNAAKNILGGGPFNIINLVESPVPPGTAAASSGKIKFMWTVTRNVDNQGITTPANILTQIVNSVVGSNKIDGFIAEGSGNTSGPTPPATTTGATPATTTGATPAPTTTTTTNPAPTTTTTTNPAPTARQVETPSNDPNVAEIYLFVDPANAPPVIQKGGSNPFSTKTDLTGLVNYVENMGISLAHNPSKKISKVEFSPILVAANTTTPQRFSVESSATLRDNSLQNVYTLPTRSSPGVLVLPKLTDPKMYISGTTKNWAKPTSQETQNLLPTTVQGYNNPTPPNLKITLTFVNV